jgi:hypothetical protein
MKLGITPDAMINPPDLPEGTGYLWGWFIDLMRGSGGELTFSEVKAWTELTGNRPTPAEVEIIMDMSFEVMKDIPKL